MSNRMITTFRLFDAAALTTSFQPMGVPLIKPSNQSFWLNASDTDVVFSYDGASDMLFLIASGGLDIVFPFDNAAWPAGQIYIRTTTAAGTGTISVNLVFGETP